MNRDESLDHYRQQPDVAVLIVGGGINGLGLLRELALQGVDVLLVDKGDFCSGASAAPSRMIHGGLRYLENGEFRLVRESLRERNLLLQNAPHYVRPLPTTIPIYNRFAGLIPAGLRFVGFGQQPVNRGALLVKIGLTLYDLLAGSARILPRHHFNTRAESLAARPQLDPRIVCTATYYDAWISYPERLGLELALDAQSIHPQARALNYVALAGGDGDTVTLRDELTGAAFNVRPQIVVNAGGAWIDWVNRALDQDTAFIGGTKGSHLIIDHPELAAALGDEMLFYENADGRICIMFRLFDKVLAGSTDIKVDDPEAALCDEDEVLYILESIGQVLPGIDVQRSHVVYQFCGVRPLPRMQASTTGEISRDHRCEVVEPTGGVTFPIYNLIGGKWTTFRAFAEQVADLLLARLKQTRKQSSEALPIGGGKDYPRTEAQRRAWLDALATQTGLPEARLRVLLERYGTRTAQVAVRMAAEPDAALTHHPGYSHREIAFMIEHECVCHLDDLILRRTTLALQGELTTPLLLELAQIAAGVHGWSTDQMQAEIERAQKILQERHGVILPHIEGAA
jgi:glycerol-3-phosphate dehydrogenase